jgi:hypothetical protein
VCAPPGVQSIDLDALAATLAPRIADLLADRISDLVAERVERLLAQLKGVLALGDDAIFSVEEAAAALNKSPATLELWRSRGLGPRAVRLGPRAVGYTLRELREYVKCSGSHSARPSIEGRRSVPALQTAKGRADG